MEVSAATRSGIDALVIATAFALAGLSLNRILAIAYGARLLNAVELEVHEVP